MALISIVVPIYNAEEYLRDTLDSIYVQTYHDWECYLVNDGSTDKSQNIIDEYCAKDKRFISLLKPNEKSADLARKYAIDRIHTDWIMHVDADDVIVPDFIERMLKRALLTGADIVCARLIGCKNGIEGIDYMIPVEEYDMSQIIVGKNAFLQTIGGWAMSANAGVLYLYRLTKMVQYGPYINSDEFSQRQLLFYAEKVAFEDVNYLYRANEGISEQFSVRMFGRTMVDCQLKDFVCRHFPDNIEKLRAITYQHMFNLIHLVSDYEEHKDLFEQNKDIIVLLKQSYKSINIKDLVHWLPFHSLMLGFCFTWFRWCAVHYVRYKKSKGSIWFYK